MVVAEENQGQLVIQDRIREMVRLAEGIDSQGRLEPLVEQRALDCLSRFGQRIRSLDSYSVNAVGTNSFRRIKSTDEFIFQAEQALGFPIEIISGIEEARLVYQGVTGTLEQDHHSRLIIDIGGGSTELVMGEGVYPQLLNSLEMGCVMITQRFFADGKVKSKRLQAARIFVLQRMKAIHYAYTSLGWDSVIGSSGSIKSIANVIHEMKMQENEGINRESLFKLIAMCSDFKKIKKLSFPGLSEKRQPVFLGGLIVLAGVFEALDIQYMHVSQGALREGLLFDMVGRRHNNDIRNKSIRYLAKRFQVDSLHAERVSVTAFDFFKQLDFKRFAEAQHYENLLKWACEIYEIGRNISHSSFQRHGAYIVENADLAGFSRQEQHRLSVIVRSHRGKIIKDSFNDIHENMRQNLIYLTVILRLSVIFHRSRIENKLPKILISISERILTLRLPDQWLNEHPLTINDLQQEYEYLLGAGLVLKVERLV